jgi:hypothetical protein
MWGGRHCGEDKYDNPLCRVGCNLFAAITSQSKVEAIKKLCHVIFKKYNRRAQI